MLLPFYSINTADPQKHGKLRNRPKTDFRNMLDATDLLRFYASPKNGPGFRRQRDGYTGPSKPLRKHLLRLVECGS